MFRINYRYWLGFAAVGLVLLLAGCAQNCPGGQKDCVSSPSPASIGGFIW